MREDPVAVWERRKEGKEESEEGEMELMKAVVVGSKLLISVEEEDDGRSLEGRKRK